MDWDWQKRAIAASLPAIDWRDFSSLRRPLSRRKENSAAASRKPERSDRVTSRYILRRLRAATSSPPMPNHRHAAAEAGQPRHRCRRRPTAAAVAVAPLAPRLLQVHLSPPIPFLLHDQACPSSSNVPRILPSFLMSFYVTTQRSPPIRRAPVAHDRPDLRSLVRYIPLIPSKYGQQILPIK
ncbi:unnamed protein product [Spirodela intermedia]|uniref:Uncharacterized protein n=1 Tax=Spirodela intermedia TaxID=51605 RepID=A0A7I8J9W2_SPIIN|nr:unnamed protein product [Spirodela intermedia]CAA6666879.1 unnamed protein product [Spirodela intermedia]